MKWLAVDSSCQLRVANNLGLVIFGSTGKCEVVIELVREGVQALVLGIVSSKNQDDLELMVTTVHQKPNTHAETMIHGLVRDRAQARVKGLIQIKPQAQRVTDFLTERLLLLSAEAKALAEPELEIEADEVRASHAATVAPIDKEEQFYLMSRGVSADNAEKLIVSGFINQVVRQIDNAKIRRQAKDYVKS